MTLTAEQNEILDLRDRVHDLEEENGKLRRMLRGTVPFPLEWKLSPSHTAVLGCLYRSPAGYASEEMLLSALQQRHGARASVITLKVHMHRLRRLVAPVGITILCRWGEGYELGPGARAVLDEVTQARALS
jgi:DNA-binding response OmpR family regulator